MSVMNACYAAGFNGGTYPCAPMPGVPKYVAKWEGKLTVADLLQGDLFCEGKLIADSKKGKKNPSKLVLYPLVREVTLKKEANTEVKYADGYTEQTREGIPGYEFKVKDVDLYLASQLRKGNNVNTRYAIIDDQKQFLATFNSDGEVIGRSGKFFMDGVDVRGYDKGKGETMIYLQADNTFETYDTAAVINLSQTAGFLFKLLRDVQLYEKATAVHSGGVAASSSGFVISNVGADADTIDVKVNGVSISGGPVAKTSSETTVTLLATKVKDAINAATLTNGGFSATSSAGGVILAGPLAKGPLLNGAVGSVTIVGGIVTGGVTAFSGGVWTNTTLKISGRTPSPVATVELDFYPDFSASVLGTDKTLWLPTTTAGLPIVPTSVTPNAAGYFDLLLPALPAGTYIIKAAEPEVLDAALVKGIELNSFVYTKA